MPKKSKKISSKRWWIWLGLVALALAIFFVSARQPSNTRNWEAEFAVQPTIFIKDNLITINNIRDWRYSDSEIISNNYISRTYDVNKLNRMWFVLEPFGKWDGIAHTYFVFDFEDQDPLVFSIEARREEDEVYSAFTGLFKKFETIYLWGTEADFTAGRAVYKKNNLYMFPLRTSDNFEKKLFLELAQETLKLQDHPKFYNTLTSNCTNNLADFANNVKKGTIPFHYARFLTGYAGDLLYDLDYIPHDKPYEEIKKEYHINDLVEQYYQDSNFSEKLRAGLPINP